MTITFNIDKSQRKALAHRIGELMGAELRYCGVPSCAYQIGSMALGKDAVLTGEDAEDAIRTLLNALKSDGYQFSADSFQNAQESACGEADSTEDDITHLTISMPRSFFTEQALDNLRRIVFNKAVLINHALGTDSLDIAVTDEKVEFPWFTLTEEGDSAAYMQFIPMLCEFAKVRKRVVDKATDVNNEKYAFRCFLLRLGMIGEEYKAARKVLLRNLTGSSAFRSGKPEPFENQSQPEEGVQDENTISE